MVRPLGRRNAGMFGRMLKMPRELTTCPRPPQPAQTFMAEPLSLPVLRQASHASGLVRVISFLATVGRLEKGDLQVVAQIRSPRRLVGVAPLPSPEQILENAAAAAENLAKNVRGVVKPGVGAARPRARASKAAWPCWS